MKPAAWLGLFIILSAVGFGAKAFVKNLTPYVSFREARQDGAGGGISTVQVMGALDKTSIVYDSKQLSFTIVSPDGDRMPVRFTAARPGNFNEATQVTAIGHYDGQVFQADNLLVKCPSKYQGTEQERSYGARAAAGVIASSAVVFSAIFRSLKALSGRPAASAAPRGEMV